MNGLGCHARPFLVEPELSRRILRLGDADVTDNTIHSAGRDIDDVNDDENGHCCCENVKKNCFMLLKEPPFFKIVADFLMWLVKYKLFLTKNQMHFVFANKK